MQITGPFLVDIDNQIRNSLKYVSYKDRKELAADLKFVYSSITEDEALNALGELDLKWANNIRI